MGLSDFECAANYPLKSITDKILLNVKQNGPFCNMNLRLHLLILRASKTWELRGDHNYALITPKIYATTFIFDVL